MDRSYSGEASRAAAKAQLRAQFRAARMKMPVEDAAACALAIRTALRGLPEARAARTIYAFWPLLTRGEIELRPLLVSWHADGKTVALPRVEGFAPPRLAFHIWHPDDARVTSSFGVEEPALDTPLAPLPDLIVVPALAVDQRGYRLGYGGGFYDAFLERATAFTVVPLPDAALVERLPIDPHDRAVHAVVTEQRVVRFSPSSQP